MMWSRWVGRLFITSMEGGKVGIERLGYGGECVESM